MTQQYYSNLSHSSALPKKTLKKLSELNTRLLESEESAPLLNSEGEEILNAQALAGQLFSKATPSYLAGKELSELQKVVAESMRALEAVVERGEQVVIGSSRSKLDDSTAIGRLVIAQGDRPFIINSITECIRELELHISIFLHPIFLIEGYRISLAYLEIRQISEETLQVLTRRVQESLKDLRLATEDFTSMIVHTETIGRMMANPRHSAIFPQTERKEVAEFLHWLTDDGFIFLGHAEWKVIRDEIDGDTPGHTLGMFRSEQPYLDTLIKECREDAQELLTKGELIHLSKLRTKSQIHRRSRINHVALLEISSNGQISSIHSLVGMFTSRALAQESSSVPLIRKKLESLIEAENVYENSYDYKTMVNIIDSMPKDEAFRMSTDGLRDLVHSIMGIQNKNDTRVSIRFDAARRGVSILLVLPRDRFNTQVRDKLQSYIESVFRARPGSSEYHLDLTNRPHARLYFYIPISEGELPTIDLARLEQDIAKLSRTWNNSLEEYLFNSAVYDDPADIWFQFEDAFSEDYQALQKIEDAAQDISVIQNLTQSDYLKVGLGIGAASPQGIYTIIVYQKEHELTLSQTLPVLENAGFEVRHEQSSCVRPRGKRSTFVHRFQVKLKGESTASLAHFDSVVAPGLAAVFKEEATNDILNSLMIFAGLSPDIIRLLRSYCNLLWQITEFASRSAIYGCLSGQPWAAEALWKLFDLKFNPVHEASLEQRLEQFEEQQAAFAEELRNVSSITNDRILRSLLSLLQNTVRTNFYHRSETVVLKLRSDRIDIMPHPRPMYEIFVHGHSLQGTHLRSGPIARGGIRWSERPEDFRNEVLGLMKTQKVKNALIVPEGAKGGFVVNSLPADPKEIKTTVESAYRTYIRSLLSISDNRVNGEIVHPPRCVVFDGDDPYFVVAADKGTATFSDVANRIAVEEFNFWLGDAFASGGSNGYDHKLYGITARGAWESVIRHFKDINLNYETRPFTVVGIGDMSGDVFGNGLLYSRNIKLLGAFNHRHVFLDPDPDPELSFQERERLFKTPGSQWSDYNHQLISSGGGVFGRFDKEINLSEEVRIALSIPAAVPATVNGEELIALIMKAEVDLLWNGGIGTYVKSKAENNAEVNDGTNDRVRINASELRARVIGEGGNLGFTQRARIEYANQGGCINTDAIDNSGGVDLSDHEVNLKILFTELMRQEKITFEERNQLLLDIAPSVVDDVLNHNKNHAFLLTVGHQRSRRNVAYFRSLISEVSRLGFIDRQLEFLPSDEELAEKLSKGSGLTRPELAICLGSVKMFMKATLMNSELPRDPLLKSFLLDYFPVELQKRYSEEILRHPLAHQIISTQLSNTLVDNGGITFIHRMCVNNSVTPVTVMKCMLAAGLILNLKMIRHEARAFDTFENKKTFTDLRKEIGGALREATSWMISYYGNVLTLQEMVQMFQEPFGRLLENFDAVLREEESEIFVARCKHYEKLGLTPGPARYLAAFPHVVQSLEMLWTAQEAAADITTVARVYEQVIEALNIRPVLAFQTRVTTTSKWENELLINSYEDINRGISAVTVALIAGGYTDLGKVREVVRQSPCFDPLQSTLEELDHKTVSAAALSVVAKQLRIYSV